MCSGVIRSRSAADPSDASNMILNSDRCVFYLISRQRPSGPVRFMPKSKTPAATLMKRPELIGRLPTLGGTFWQTGCEHMRQQALLIQEGRR
jgi:hypothetical protein